MNGLLPADHEPSLEYNDSSYPRVLYYYVLFLALAPYAIQTPPNKSPRGKICSYSKCLAQEHRDGDTLRGYQ